VVFSATAEESVDQPAAHRKVCLAIKKQYFSETKRGNEFYSRTLLPMIRCAIGKFTDNARNFE
jgi:hypothetical protein